MALAHSSSIVTNGLSFYYDMSNSQKSWRGRPVVNQFALPEADVNGFGVQNGTFTRTRSGTFAGYSIQPSDYVWRFNISGNECPYHGNDVTINAGQTATFSFDYYVDPSTSNYVVTNYLANFEGVVGGSVGDPTPSIKGVWKRAVFSATAGSTGLCRMLLYPGSCGGRLGDSGFILYRNPQVEFDAPGLAASPFVAGTRLANNNLETTPSFPTWNATAGSSASGGTLTFSGGSYNSKNSWDLYKTYSGLSTGVNYTWSALVRTGTASNLIVTMNNTQSWNTGPSAVFAGLSSTEWTRISITGTTNSGSFNLHLGASFNNEVASTSQSAGTIFIQDVRLFLTQSQTSLTDLMDRNTVTTSSLTYASDGTFSFNGSSDYLTIPNTTLGNGNIAWTVSCWMKTTTTTNSLGQGSVLSNISGGPVYSMMGVNNGKIVYWTYQNSAWTQKLGVGTTVNDGNWHMLTWVNYANYTMDMYVDGILDSNVANSTSGNNNPVDVIGRSWTGYFPGSIASLSRYTRSLTAAEVQQNFNALRGRYGI